MLRVSARAGPASFFRPCQGTQSIPCPFHWCIFFIRWFFKECRPITGCYSYGTSTSLVAGGTQRFASQRPSLRARFSPSTRRWCWQQLALPLSTCPQCPVQTAGARQRASRLPTQSTEHVRSEPRCSLCLRRICGRCCPCLCRST